MCLARKTGGGQKGQILKTVFGKGWRGGKVKKTTPLLGKLHNFERREMERRGFACVYKKRQRERKPSSPPPNQCCASSNGWRGGKAKKTAPLVEKLHNIERRERVPLCL